MVQINPRPDTYHKMTLVVEVGDSECSVTHTVERIFTLLSDARKELAYLYGCAQSLGMEIIEDNIKEVSR